MARENLKQIAYTQIKNQILYCELEPNAFLNEEMLCDTLCMSRTPVRDALGRLEQEGLIQIVPKKGFFVTPVSFNEINMVYEGRMLIEPYVLRNYCDQLRKDKIKALEATLEAEKSSIGRSSERIFIYDNDFHDMLISLCQNRYFLDLYCKLRDSNMRLRIVSGMNAEDRLKATVEEHLAVFSGILENNSEKAAAAMIEHLEKSREAAFRSFSS